MSEYKPGTVAVATVKGVEGVRVLARPATLRSEGGWFSSERIGGSAVHYDEDVTEVHPLVVLDIATIKALSPEAMRAALVYISGYSPNAFAVAMRHLDKFPASSGFLSEATS